MINPLTRRILTGTVVVISLSAPACKKTTTTPAPPKPVAAFAATINGTAISSGWIWVSNGNPGTGFVEISAGVSDASSDGILLQANNVVAPTTVTLNSNASLGSFGQYSSGPAATEIMYRTDASHTGTITFTQVDATNKLLSGTFTFTALQYSPAGTPTVNVTNGSFSNITW